mmetsp:Transcript_72016/g.142793  ORF Transcript_72016/g.142793 Transcript_72016/m.142793 type:complete len:143 (+) Transcript_72016:675-1103(+)
MLRSVCKMSFSKCSAPLGKPSHPKRCTYSDTHPCNGKPLSSDAALPCRWLPPLPAPDEDAFKLGRADAGEARSPLDVPQPEQQLLPSRGSVPGGAAIAQLHQPTPAPQAVVEVTAGCGAAFTGAHPEAPAEAKGEGEPAATE